MNPRTLIFRFGHREQRGARAIDPVHLWPEVVSIDPLAFSELDVVIPFVNREGGTGKSPPAPDGKYAVFSPHEAPIDEERPELSALAGWTELVIHELIERFPECGIDPHPGDGMGYEQWDWLRHRLFESFVYLADTWPRPAEAVA